MDFPSALLGFLLGILFVIVAISITLYFGNKRFLKKTLLANSVSNNDIDQLISSKQRKMMKSTKIGLSNNFSLTKELLEEMIIDMANYYYPDSKYPHLEISFQDVLELNERVTKRLIKVMDLKGVGMIKNIRISQIISILELKRNIENNKVVQFSKKYNLDKVLKYGYAAINLINPAYWVRKVIYTSTLETTLRGMGVMTLGIVGEEANRVYSQKLIDNRDKILDKEIERFIKEIEMSTN